MEPSLGLAGKLKTARKGGGRFSIVVEGQAAHAGLDPEGGASAILELRTFPEFVYADAMVERSALLAALIMDPPIVERSRM